MFGEELYKQSAAHRWINIPCKLSSDDIWRILHVSVKISHLFCLWGQGVCLEVKIDLYTNTSDHFVNWLTNFTVNNHDDIDFVI